MRLLKRIVYRSFQGAMRALLPLFPFREPELIKDTAGVVDVLRSRGVGRILLIAGKTVHGRGLTAALEEALTDAGIEFVIFDGTRPDPTSDNVEAARELYIASASLGIIAFGGGSAMDCAKAVGARIVRPNKPLDKMAGLIKIRRKLPLFIAIPTTAGTGSETTVASVIVDAKTHRKYVISDFCLIPHYALLDPAVTIGLPPHLTATTGMDALTHAVEAYIGKARTRATSRASVEAVRLIFENLERAYEVGEDLEARRNMLRASYLAGTAFTRSYVGYVHAVAHTLGGRYGVAHGLANAVLLPKVLRAYGDRAAKPLAELSRAVGLSSSSADDVTAAEEFISRIEGMNERMNIPDAIDSIKPEDIPEMAKLADKEANPLYPVPVLWDAGELETLYRIARGDNSAQN